MEFDKLSFKILEHAQPNVMGYINDEKALELMDKGLIIKSPKSEWFRSGHKTTKKGTELYKKWLSEIREKHGHIWLTKRENNPDCYEENHKNANEPDSFAYSEGYHNGFVCKICDFSFCQHCNDECDIPVCDVKNKNISPMKDDEKLDKNLVELDKKFREELRK